jgi:cytochrome c oxidase assembly protein subunit 11
MKPDSHAESTADKNRKVTRYLLLLVVGMFAFGFALVPLYRLACDVGGINGVAGNSGRVVEALDSRVDKSRWITVQFDSTVNAALPWEFHPMVRQIQVHPGQQAVVRYYVRNNADHAIVGQAVPGITPWQVTKYFRKIECFCFTQQTLQAGEAREMPVVFTIDPAVEAEYGTVTLSYTFMNTGQVSSN